MKVKNYEPSLKRAIAYCKRNILKNKGYSFGEYLDDAKYQYYLRDDEFPYLVRDIKKWIEKEPLFVSYRTILEAKEYVLGE